GDRRRRRSADAAVGGALRYVRHGTIEADRIGTLRDIAVEVEPVGPGIEERSRSYALESGIDAQVIEALDVGLLPQNRDRPRLIIALGTDTEIKRAGDGQFAIGANRGQIYDY